MSSTSLAAAKPALQLWSYTVSYYSALNSIHLFLMRRYEQYVARGGQTGPAAVEAPAAAIRGALRYVQHFNAYTLLAGAQAAVAEAWLQLTQVCCPCCVWLCAYNLVCVCNEKRGVSDAVAVCVFVCVCLCVYQMSLHVRSVNAT